MAKAPKGVLKKSRFPLVIKKKSIFGTSVIKKSMVGGMPTVQTWANAKKQQRNTNDKR